MDVYMRGLKYSYTVFKREDLEPIEILDKNQLERIDNVDITELNPYDKNNLIDKYVNMYDKKVMQFGKQRNYFFKDFTIKEKMSDDIIRYYHYTLTDWDRSDKVKNLDTRNLTISIYEDSEDGFNHLVSFRIKVDHIWQLYSDIQDYLDRCNMYELTEINRSTINLFWYPVYIYRDRYTYDDSYDKMDKFSRISTIYYYRTNNELNSFFKDFSLLDLSTYRYLFINEYIYQSINNTKLFNIDGKTISGDNARSYLAKVTSDRKVVVDLDKVKVRMNPQKKNVYVDIHTSMVRAIYEYRVQVPPHKQRYWYGSKKDGNRHCEVLMVPAYYRHPNAKYNTIKTYESEETKEKL